MTVNTIMPQSDPNEITIYANFHSTQPNGGRYVRTTNLSSDVLSAMSWMIAASTMTPIVVDGHLWYVKMARPIYTQDGIMIAMNAILIEVIDDEHNPAG